MSQSPAQHHWCWPGLASPHPAHHHWGWPGLGFFFSSFPPSFPLLPPPWPPRPLESKVIPIQSDHLLATSPPVAAMERSKGTCSIQVCWRKLGPHQEGRRPSHEVPWISCWLGPSFSSSSLTLLFSPSDLLTKDMDKSPWCLKRVWSTPSAPPFSLHFAQALLGWLLHALEMIFAMLPHWVPLTLSLASHLLDIFSTMVWLGLAICWRRTSERILSVARCMLCPLFHAVSPSPGWSSCLALSNQQACGRPFCFTGRSRPLGTRFSIGSMVLSLWSAPSSLEIPALRVTRYRLAPVDHLLVPLSPAKLPVSYPFFPILALHRFWPYRLLPPTASV